MTENVDASKREESLQVGRRAARGSLIEMVTFVVSYGLRFVSSMALRGLLFPAAFGVMEVVTGVNVGLAMLTDVGIREAAIRSERGEEQVFLDTAWTMHVVRGVALWLVTVVLAYPAALLSNEPSLVYVLPIASLSTLILGFVSTADLTLRRRMRIGKINALSRAANLLSGDARLVAPEIGNPSDGSPKCPGISGLAHKGVGPRIEAIRRDSVVVVATENDYRSQVHERVGANPQKKIQARHSRQMQVEEDKVKR